MSETVTDPDRISVTPGYLAFLHTVTTGGLNVEDVHVECLAYAYDELRGSRFKAVRAAHDRGWEIKHPTPTRRKGWSL